MCVCVCVCVCVLQAQIASLEESKQQQRAVLDQLEDRIRYSGGGSPVLVTGGEKV